jgi:hypothetical protein
VATKNEDVTIETVSINGDNEKKYDVPQTNKQEERIEVKNLSKENGTVLSSYKISV